jgi:protein phosphatase
MATEQNLSQEKATEKTIRLVRPSVVVLCGPAACGKSTFAQRHFRPTQVISSDWGRAHVCDDERDQRYNAPAFALVHFLIEQRLSVNRLCVVDSTALTQQARRDLLDLARKSQVPCVALLLDVPLEKCVARDQSRERTVGLPVIERQYQFFEQAKAGIRQEGFDQVIELRDEDLENVRIEIIFRPVSRPTAAAARPPQRPPRREPWPAHAVPRNATGGQAAKPPAWVRPPAPATRPVAPVAQLAPASAGEGPAAAPTQEPPAPATVTAPASASAPASQPSPSVQTAPPAAPSSPPAPASKPPEQGGA